MKRFTDTDLWDKGWFMSLPAKHKLLIQFIFSKCDNAGVWEPNFAVASLYIGEKITEDDLKPLQSQILKLESGKYLIPDFINFQYGTLSEKSAPHRKVMSLLSKHKIKSSLLSSLHSSLLSSPKEEEEKDKDKDKKEDNGYDERNEDEAPDTEPQIKGFYKIETLKGKCLENQRFMQTFSLWGLTDIQINGWLDAFNRWLEYRNETLKQEADYSKHFGNWLKSQPYKTTNPADWQPMAQQQNKGQPNSTGYQKLKSAKEILEERNRK